MLADSVVIDASVVWFLLAVLLVVLIVRRF